MRRTVDSIRSGATVLTPALGYVIEHPGEAPLALPPGRTPRPRLTPTEVCVVEDLALGKRAEQIAHERAVAQAAIRTQIANAKRKLGARTMPKWGAVHCPARPESYQRGMLMIRRVVRLRGAALGAHDPAGLHWSVRWLLSREMVDLVMGGV
jgi:DNA-binding NarL/FixJ family response regulator